MYKIKNKNLLIKKNLYKLYKKNNPSIPTNLKKRLKINKNIFEKLSFPLRFFKDLTVGDIGCGTGEYSMVAANNGAKVEGFDFNEVSINLAKKNSKKLKINNCNFYKEEFFKVKKKYDFVISTGVLHHLPDPYAGLKYLSSRVKKNGFLFVAFGLNSSNITHNLMKLIVRNWGKNEKQIIKASKFLFQNHINRCVKIGLRKETSVLTDQFLNTQHNYLKLEKVLKTLRKKDFSLHSSWPPKYQPLSDPINNISIKNENFNSSEYIWSSKTFSDKIRSSKFTNYKKNKSFQNFLDILNNNPNKSMNEILEKKKLLNIQEKINFRKLDFSFDLNNYVKNFYNEIYELIKYLKKNSTMNDVKKEIQRKKHIFKGTNGLGMNYFIFKKN